MEEIKIERYYRCHGDEELKQVNQLFDCLHDEWLTKDFIYIKITEGQYKDSIAKLVGKEAPHISYTPKFKWQGRRGEEPELDYMQVDIYYEGICKWAGLTNTKKVYLPSREVIWLKDYKGNTIRKCIDPKEEKAKAIARPIYDIDDDRLRVGDKVVYINARYGSGMILSFGVIDRLEAVYDSSNNSCKVFTIVKSLDCEEESKIRYAHEFIYKMED